MLKMIKCHFLLTFVIVCRYGVFAKVRFEFGNLISPILVKTDNGNGTVFANTRLMINLKCLATYPTQWNFENDDISRIAFRQEWTQRQVKGSINEKQYNYISLIKVQYSIIVTSPQIFKCSPVNYLDEQEVLVLKFIPLENRVVLTTHYDIFRPELPKPLTPCDLKLLFVNAGPYGLHVRCINAHTEEVGVVQIHHCPQSSAYCSNTLRNLKSLKNTCAEKLNDTSDEPVEEDGWTKIRFATSKTTLIPGIVECSVAEFRGAQEYFFTAPKIGDEISNNRGQLHFSWNEILPKDMIWLRMTTIPSVSTNSYYYTEQSQNISGICTVPKYGFAVEPVLILKLNGTTLSEERNFVNVNEEDTWQKHFELKLNKPGRYEVMCMGPVWNTTEWAIQTFQCNVKDSIPPHFDDPLPQLVTLMDGEINEVNCTANGDPTPTVQWYFRKGGNLITTSGGTLTFMYPILSNNGTYSCNATNAFGQSTVKIFLVTVLRQGTSNNVTSSNGGLIFLAVVAVLILTCVFVVTEYFITSRPGNKIGSTDQCTTVESIPLCETLSCGTDTAIGPSILEVDVVPNPNDELLYVRLLIQTSKFDLHSHNFEFGTIPSTGGVKGRVTTRNGTFDAFIRQVDSLETKFIEQLRVEFAAYLKMSRTIPSTHPSIVNLLGACAGTNWIDDILIATDYCEWKMFDFLQNKMIKFDNWVTNGVLTPGKILWGSVIRNKDHSTTIQFSTPDMIAWGKEIASALKFIGSKGIIHEQFGMQNIYLTPKYDTIESKVGGFGRTKHLEPEECAKLGSEAFASTQWHMFTFGENLNRRVQSDELLLQPRNAPNEVFDMMKKCLNSDTSARPSLPTVIDFLDACLDSSLNAWVL